MRSAQTKLLFLLVVDDCWIYGLDDQIIRSEKTEGDFQIKCLDSVGENGKMLEKSENCVEKVIMVVDNTYDIDEF